jgi:hypothetical protein
VFSILASKQVVYFVGSTNHRASLRRSYVPSAGSKCWIQILDPSAGSEQMNTPHNFYYLCSLLLSTLTVNLPIVLEL